MPTISSEKKCVVPISDEEVTIFEDRFHRVLMGGYQLTAARVRSSQRIMRNSERGLERLDGLSAVVEDWHTKQCLMQVITCHVSFY